MEVLVRVMFDVILGGGRDEVLSSRRSYSVSMVPIIQVLGTGVDDDGPGGGGLVV